VPYDTRGLRLRSRFKTGDYFPLLPESLKDQRDRFGRMPLPENRVRKAVLPDSGSSPKIRSITFRGASAASSQPRFRQRSSQCSVATPQLLLPSGIGSRFPTQAGRLFSFHRNLRSIVAIGSTRLESPWLRARWKVGGFDLSSIRSRPRFCGSNSGPTKEKAVTYQTCQRQIFRVRISQMTTYTLPGRLSRL